MLHWIFGWHFLQKFSVLLFFFYADTIYMSWFLLFVILFFIVFLFYCGNKCLCLHFCFPFFHFVSTYMADNTKHSYKLDSSILSPPYHGLWLVCFSFFSYFICFSYWLFWRRLVCSINGQRNGPDHCVAIRPISKSYTPQGCRMHLTFLFFLAERSHQKKVTVCSTLLTDCNIGGEAGKKSIQEYI